ncbi:E3 ubiquitin-protein ligase ORTHRUS 2-like [Bidens hawaiensis]|uniref:E3 ubiquitin-protein ligase ORTHRUS 2-like n=1 Tax=Bidens hawaiensis TaxID=980011 RepID=UPI00404B3684
MNNNTTSQQLRMHGGRDLSGNKRTNKTQSFDQKFDKSNEALRVSCKKGYPVRVVRSHKEKRSAYAPEQGVRYDGVYRIEKCWRKPGIQGYKVCRYLFVRCDNDPAPWTSDEIGDCPRPLPAIKELKDASDVTERKGSPSRDYDEEKACWLWKIPPPASKKQTNQRDAGDGTQTRVVRRKTQMMSVSERLLKAFCCLICHKVMNLPLTTPCAHNFCKSCLQDTFAGQTFIKERNCEGRRTLRAQKNVMKCPSCTNDISEYLLNPQVNRELMSVIETLQRQIKESEENAVSEEEKSNEDEKNDVKEEEKDDNEVKDVCSEGDEDIKESGEDEVIAKTSPKANKKRKAADVTENADNDDNQITKDYANSGLVESEDLKADEAAKRGKKGSKKKKDDRKCSSPKANKKRKAADATENAPGEKLHEEANNDNNQITKDTANSGLVESEDLKADEAAKIGKKGSKKKKDDGKCSSPAGAGARTRSRKA